MTISFLSLFPLLDVHLGAQRDLAAAGLVRLLQLPFDDVSARREVGRGDALHHVGELDLRLSI